MRQLWAGERGGRVMLEGMGWSGWWRAGLQLNGERPTRAPCLWGEKQPRQPLVIAPSAPPTAVYPPELASQAPVQPPVTAVAIALKEPPLEHPSTLGEQRSDNPTLARR